MVLVASPVIGAAMVRPAPCIVSVLVLRTRLPVLNIPVVRVSEPLLIVVVLARSEEHTSELQSRLHLVCRLLLEKKKSHTQRCAPPCSCNRSSRRSSRRC